MAKRAGVYIACGVYINTAAAGEATYPTLVITMITKRGIMTCLPADG